MTTSTRAKVPPTATRYEDDVYTWLQEQIALLRAGKIADIDADNIAEELSDVGNEIRDKLESAIAVVAQHLLKWDYQTARRSRSWVLSIREHRRRVSLLLERNPGLKGKLRKSLTVGYANGRDRALDETKFADDALPENCPYTLDEMMTRPIEYVAPPAGKRKRKVP